jgi:hypothetical protein
MLTRESPLPLPFFLEKEFFRDPIRLLLWLSPWPGSANETDLSPLASFFSKRPVED